jgi:hypothetical protein
LQSKHSMTELRCRPQRPSNLRKSDVSPLGVGSGFTPDFAAGFGIAGV